MRIIVKVDDEFRESCRFYLSRGRAGDAADMVPPVKITVT